MRMKFGDCRLEPAYRASADPEPNMARLDLRKIVAQLRGEYVGDPT